MSSNNSSDTKEQGSYAAGVTLGALIGGASLFFFQTKAGQKIHNQLKDEFQSGNFDFKNLQDQTNKKIENFLSSSLIKDQLKGIIKNTSIKSTSSKSTSSKPKRRFFSKKGKKLS